MPPIIKNIRHEKFAQAIVDPSTTSNTEAYMKAYPDSSYENARSAAPLVLANPRVKQRIIEIMESKKGTSPVGIVEKLNEHVYSNDANVSISAIDKCLKVYGAYEDKENNNSSPINFSFNVVKPSDIKS